MARIVLVHPAPNGIITGNHVTARRWGETLRNLGHHVEIVSGIPKHAGDLLIALHARKSAAAVRACRRQSPHTPVVVALTGTDLYHDLEHNAAARGAVDTADRLIVLHPEAGLDLPGSQRGKVVFVPQSTRMPKTRRSVNPRFFDVAVLANLRSVKDPLRAAVAARALPEASHIRVVHAGATLDQRLRVHAEKEVHRNPRYVWKGHIPRGRAKQLLADSKVLVVSSRLEGGANVISEAAIAGIPILATRVPGNVGLLGRAYPGYFSIEDTKELTRLLSRVENDPRFLADLRRRVSTLARMFHPARERDALRDLVEALL